MKVHPAQHRTFILSYRSMLCSGALLCSVACSSKQRSFTPSIDENLSSEVSKANDFDQNDATARQRIEFKDPNLLNLFFDAKQLSNPEQNSYTLSYGGSQEAIGELGKGAISTADRFPTQYFQISFSFQITDGAHNIKNDCRGFLSNGDGGPIGADGIFVGIVPKALDISNSLAGGGLGILGAQGLGVEYDTFKNSEYGDSNGNHIAVVAEVGQSLQHMSQVSDGLPYLNDGAVHKTVITLSQSKVEISLDGKKVLESAGIKGQLAEENYLVISAGVGCGRNEHRITDLSIEFKPKTTR